jgi:two-component system response regulator YesN
VEKNYSKAITVQHIAEMIQMNPDYFSHLFKSSMGINFIEFLNRYRIDKAEELLSKGNYKVYEVAEMVGFNEYKYFARLFRRLKGYCPTEVEKQNRKKLN